MERKFPEVQQAEFMLTEVIDLGVCVIAAVTAVGLEVGGAWLHTDNQGWLIFRQGATNFSWALAGAGLGAALVNGEKAIKGVFKKTNKSVSGGK